MSKQLDGVVKYLSAFVFGKKGDHILTQREAWKREADCGCGIDCCNKEFVLEDKTTNVKSTLYFNNSKLWLKVGDNAPVEVAVVGA